MEYVYATLLVNEAGGELNESNLTAVLEAAGCSVSESRVRALVAALEGVDIGGIDADALADGAKPVDAERAAAAPTDDAPPEPSADGAPPEG